MNQSPHATNKSAKLEPTSARHSVDTPALIDELANSVRQALADHQTMLAVLLQRRADLPLELGEVFEDASNAYMEMSESVSQIFLTARSPALE